MDDYFKNKPKKGKEEEKTEEKEKEWRVLIKLKILNFKHSNILSTKIYRL